MASKKIGFFTRLRQALLFYVLVMVALGAWLARERSTDWNDTLWVSLYPIDAAGNARVGEYLARLEDRDFDAVERFFEAEGARYGLTLDRPLRIDLKAPLAQRPPAPPADRHALAVMAWSLRLRYWSWRISRGQDGPAPDIKVFVSYFDPNRTEQLAHSVGLQKGLLGVVNAFGARSYTAQNNFVIAHELLHTLGATDKYDAATTLPLHPHGYADPEREPLLPQVKAEIMGGRVPITPTRADMPESLRDALVGPLTATEIRWLTQD